MPVVANVGKLITSDNYRKVVLALNTVRTVTRLNCSVSSKLPDATTLRDRRDAARGYVDSLLSVLSAEELMVLKCRYYDAKSWVTTAFTLSYSERQCQRILRRALWRLADYQDRLDRAARRGGGGDGSGASPVTVASLCPLPSLS